MARFQAQFPDQFVALASSDDSLLVLAFHHLHPLVHREVGRVVDELVPLLGKVIAHWHVLATHRRQFDSGVGEVQVWVLQFLKHGLRARCTIVEQCACQSQCQCLLAAALRTTEHQCMRQTVFFYHLHQPIFGFLLSNYLVECHTKRFTTSTTESTAGCWVDCAKEIPAKARDINAAKKHLCIDKIIVLNLVKGFKKKPA